MAPETFDDSLGNDVMFDFDEELVKHRVQVISVRCTRLDQSESRKKKL